MWGAVHDLRVLVLAAVLGFVRQLALLDVVSLAVACGAPVAAVVALPLSVYVSASIHHVVAVAAVSFRPSSSVLLTVAEVAFFDYLGLLVCGVAVWVWAVVVQTVGTRSSCCHSQPPS